MAWLFDAFIYLRDIITRRYYFWHDSIPRAIRRKFAHTFAHPGMTRRTLGINLLKGSNERAVCILITLPDIFNIPRMDAVNWIHLFPFLKIRLRAGTRFSDISRGYAFACSSSPSSSVIILRNFNPPLRYRVRSLSGSIPDRLRRYENRTRSRTRLLSSNICSYCSNCFLSRNDLIIVDSPLAASPFWRWTFALFVSMTWFSLLFFFKCMRLLQVVSMIVMDFFNLV